MAFFVFAIVARVERRHFRQACGSGGTSPSRLPQLLREGAAHAKPQTWKRLGGNLALPIPIPLGIGLVQIRKAGFPAAEICGEFRMLRAVCVRHGPTAGVGFREFRTVESEIVGRCPSHAGAAPAPGQDLTDVDPPHGSRSVDR
jgi:hypothetical protein